VQKVVESAGFTVVRDYVGHGVGEQLHEDPEVPNFGSPGHGPRLVEGMTIAIEPMVNAGGWEIDILDNNWTVVTTDGKHSAHFEHTVLITADGGKPLTTAD
jgi:methionyl aminopeptidase